MKIINTSDKPFEWTFSGEIYGPVAPGQVVDLPDNVALHGIKRSVVHDDTGDDVSHRMEPLESVSKAKIREIAMYDCPFVATNQCDARAFKSADELKAHMQSHWELSEPPVQTRQGVLPQSAKRI